MNRLYSTGIGIGMAAGAVFLSNPAEASESVSMAEVSSCNSLPSSLISAARLGGIVCGLESGSDPRSQEPPKITQAEPAAIEPAGAGIKEYAIELGIVSLEAVALGAIVYRVRRKKKAKETPQKLNINDERNQRMIETFQIDIDALTFKEIREVFDTTPSVKERSKNEL